MRKVTHVDSSRDMPWFWNFIASGRSKRGEHHRAKERQDDQLDAQHELQDVERDHTERDQSP